MKDTNTTKTVSQLTCLEERKKLRYTLQAKDLVFFSSDLGQIFQSNVRNEFGVMLRSKGPHKPKFAYDNVLKYSLLIYTNLIKFNVVGDTKASLLSCFLSISKLKAGNIITTGHYQNYRTFSNM